MALSLRQHHASLGAAQFGALVTQALLDEVHLTPKPGLVDQRGAGAHTDMSMFLMEKSAHALEPYFAEMAFASMASPVNASLRQCLGEIGRQAERAMFQTTNGVNTHKGAIWILGLLLSAAAQLPGADAASIASRAGELARIPDIARPVSLSHGEVVRLRFARSGARGEAAAGFPHAISIGLPELMRSRSTGRNEEQSRLNALLAIMAALDDTCLLYRGGSDGLALVQKGASTVLSLGGVGSATGDAALYRLDESMQEAGLSPGGSADLLAATLFLDALGQQRAFDLKKG